MSWANRKGYITVKNGRGGTVSLHKDSRAVGRLKHRRKQVMKQHQAKVREFKDRLRDEKRKYPVDQRSRLTPQDLFGD